MNVCQVYSDYQRENRKVFLLQSSLIKWIASLFCGELYLSFVFDVYPRILCESAYFTTPVSFFLALRQTIVFDRSYVLQLLICRWKIVFIVFMLIYIWTGFPRALDDDCSYV